MPNHASIDATATPSSWLSLALVRAAANASLNTSLNNREPDHEVDRMCSLCTHLTVSYCDAVSPVRGREERIDIVWNTRYLSQGCHKAAGQRQSDASEYTFVTRKACGSHATLQVEYRCQIMLATIHLVEPYESSPMLSRLSLVASTAVLIT